MNNSVFICTIGIILCCLIIVLFSKPIGAIFKLIVNSAFGGICIVAFNFISQLFGFFIGVNAFTAFTVGILGIPGFVMLLMLRLIVN
ncbi:MAG: pro-sigmaK processing inhibitor BofA family protein [Clostridia bacterium]|nr:pro-sigmaK processing inhibitor BofA family protein [Clostridia bacterium]